MIELQASDDSGDSEQQDVESDEDKSIQRELNFLKQLPRAGFDDREPFVTGATHS